MKNKVLVKVIVPEINDSFDLFIPVNDLIWKINKLIIKCIFDSINIAIDRNKEFALINIDTCRIYNNNEIVIDTDIRNGSKLMLLSV